MATEIIPVGDWIGESTPTQGDGDLTLGGPLNGYATFNSSLIADSKVWYTIVEGTARETGLGTLRNNGTTLERTTIYAKLLNGIYSNTPSPLYLQGKANVYCTFQEGAYNQIFQAIIALENQSETIPTSINDLDDVDTSGVVDGDSLVWDSGAFIPGSGGEANTGENIGSESNKADIFAQKVGLNIQLRSLFPEDERITISQRSNDIEIGTTAEENKAASLGSGAEVFAGKNADTLEFKSITAGPDIVLSGDANTINISSAGTSAAPNTRIVSGGGDLSANIVHIPIDADTYDLPLASSVAEGGWVDVELLSTYNINQPIVQVKGSDTVTDGNTFDNSVLFDAGWIRVRFVSDGVSNWSF